MNENFLITIIVPVYKVEKYIVQCIDSILGQTYTHFELILVDDGSPDRSGVICDGYAERDSRVRVLHQQNAGPSRCRNRGIELASGKYLCFIDSDDWVDADYLASMVRELKEDVDLVVSGLILEKKERSIIQCEHNEFTMKDKNAFHSLIVKRLLFGPYQKIFKTSVVKENRLAFPENICYGEDRLFNYSYLYHVNSIVTIDNATYHYRIHEKGSLASNVYWNMFDLEYIQWKALYQLYKERDLLSEESNSYHWKAFYWLIVDNILNPYQWTYRKTWKEKYIYIKHILKVPEIYDLRRYRDYFKDISILQYIAVVRRNVFYFYIIHILKKK
ncbi:glycosyltransferase family 2 protein [Bacteroides congonensis]